MLQDWFEQNFFIGMMYLNFRSFNHTAIYSRMNRLRTPILYIKTWRLIQEVLISGMPASDGVSHFGRKGKHGTRNPIPPLESLPIRQKPTIIRFIIHNPSTHNKLRHPVRILSQSSSFRRTPPKMKNIYYQDTKEKKSKDFFTYGLFLSHGAYV